MVTALGIKTICTSN